jgi:hypothetical protein
MTSAWLRLHKQQESTDASFLVMNVAMTSVTNQDITVIITPEKQDFQAIIDFMTRRLRIIALKPQTRLSDRMMRTVSALNHEVLQGSQKNWDQF